MKVKQLMFYLKLQYLSSVDVECQNHLVIPSYDAISQPSTWTSSLQEKNKLVSRYRPASKKLIHNFFFSLLRRRRRRFFTSPCVLMSLRPLFICRVRYNLGMTLYGCALCRSFQTSKLCTFCRKIRFMTSGRIFRHIVSLFWRGGW